MKRFLIPAFFVVDADSLDSALQIAGEMQAAANAVPFPGKKGTHHLMLDEELPDRQVRIDPDETELPHTYRTTEPETCLRCGSPMENGFCTDPTCLNFVNIP